MKKRIITYLLCLATVLPTLSQAVITHPWSGKRVAYFGDSITDPRTRGAKKKYWGFLQDWLQITPLVYGVSGRQWNDIPRQANKLREEHGDNFDAILIFMGTNDYNNAVPIGEWYEEKLESVEYGHRYTKRMEDRMPNKSYCLPPYIAVDSTPTIPIGNALKTIATDAENTWMPMWRPSKKQAKYGQCLSLTLAPYRDYTLW